MQVNLDGAWARNRNLILPVLVKPLMIPVLTFLSASLQIGDTDWRNSQRFTLTFL